MAEGIKIEINTGIFPRVCVGSIGTDLSQEDMTNLLNGNLVADGEKVEIVMELPVGADLLYLKQLNSRDNALEIALLDKYAHGKEFTDKDYKQLLSLVIVTENKPTNHKSTTSDVFSLFGVTFSTSADGKRHPALIPEAIPEIKASTWDCIIVDLLHKQAFDIIDCFDFRVKDSSQKVRISLGSWKFSFDPIEQSLSSALRSAFIFTLAGFRFGDRQGQYSNFLDYFESEFFKRVSLVHATWISKDPQDKVEYTPLYDSFYNLDGIGKDRLIGIIKSILDNPSFVLDEKQMLKNHLITSAGKFHQEKDVKGLQLERDLIKPALNFVILREKAKDTLDAATLLCKQKMYSDCAVRCYYSMMFSLKAILESYGRLAAWELNKLKETESHRTLEIGLRDLVNEGIIPANFQADFLYVKAQRWNCDYSLYVFNGVDAEACVKKAEDFYLELELLTSR